MNANDLFKAVTELDLEPIKTKLMHVASGEGWSREKANAVEKEYRRFLCLMKLFPEEDIAPLVDVDTFWHYHILDTMKYGVDCERVFGYFLHHYPYIGLNESEEEDQLRFESGDRMRELYESVFGEAYPGWPNGDIEATVSAAAPTDAGVNARAADIAAGIAFSAGPAPDRLKAHASGVAFSAGPAPDRLKAHANGVAFSAGPAPDRLKAHANGIAFSAGPAPDRLKAHAAGIAFSAGPAPDRLKARAAGIAFSAGPAPDSRSRTPASTVSAPVRPTAN